MLERSREERGVSDQIRTVSALVADRERVKTFYPDTA